MKKLRWIVGWHGVVHALKAHPSWVQGVFLEKGKKPQYDEVQKLSQKHSIVLKEKEREFFNNLGSGHQGVAVSVEGRPRWKKEKTEKKTSLVVFLDGLTDPQNLGAILRTSWLLGVHGIFIPRERSVHLTPAVCKIASGGAEYVPIESIHFGSQLEWFKNQGYWIYGLCQGGEKSLPLADFSAKTVLVVGGESNGLRSSTKKCCDQLVQIPQVFEKASYNASSSFAMGGYEWRRAWTPEK